MHAVQASTLPIQLHSQLVWFLRKKWEDLTTYLQTQPRMCSTSCCLSLSGQELKPPFQVTAFSWCHLFKWLASTFVIFKDFGYGSVIEAGIILKHISYQYLTMQTRLGWNSWCSCLHLLTARIFGRVSPHLALISFLSNKKSVAYV